MANLMNLVWLQMRTVFGKRGLRALWMGAALVLFLKGCDGFIQMATRFDRSATGPDFAPIAMARIFVVVLLLSFFGIFLSLAIGAFVLDTDLRKRFLLNLLATPLTREEYILGKWLGALAVFATYWVFCAASYCYILAVPPWKLRENHAWVLGALAATMILNYAIASFLSLWIHPIGAFVGTFALQGASQFLLTILAFWGSAWWAPIVKILFYLLPSPARQNPVAFAARLTPIPNIGMPGIQPDPIVFIHNLSYSALLMWVFWITVKRRSLRG
ncbi:MAG: ABC transporter permease subunit [bacterium JZ-2024 1]